MAIRFRRRSLAAIVAPVMGAAFLCGVAKGSDCDSYPVVRGQVCPPVIEMAPVYPSQPTLVAPDAAAGMPSDQAVPPAPGTPPPSTEVPPAVPSTEIPPATTDTPDFADFDLSTGLATNFGGGGASSLAFADAPIVTPGYIDSAVIQTRIRVRYDNAQGANDAARAGFMYPTPASNNNNNVTGGRGPVAFGGGAPGSGDIDMEEVSTYIELAVRERFSLFLDVPVRWVGPIDFQGATGFDNGTQRGAGDIRAGFRWGWIDDPCEHLTLQVRTWLPTGDARTALGTGNTAIDVGLIYDQQIGSRTRFYAEINDWQTLDAVTLADTGGSGIDPSLLNQDANILRGGVGLGYDLLECGTRCEPSVLTILGEVVAWTVLDGNTVDLNTSLLSDAEGDTIVNGKYGVRYVKGVHSMYAGYGHNWTSDRWYSDLLRLEYQRAF